MKKGFFSKLIQINIRDRVFLKTFILFTVATVIPAICIGVSSIKHSSDHIIEQMDQSIGAVLTDKANIIDQRLGAVDNSAIQIVLNGEIWEFMSRDDLSGKVHLRGSSVNMMDVFNLIYNTVKANQLVDSAYLFSSCSNTVLTSTVYSKANFYDQEALNFSFEGYYYISPPRVILTQNEGEKEVISYVRKFDIFPSWDNMYVAINIRYAKMFEDIILEDMEHPYELIFVNGSCDNVYSSNSIDIELGKTDIEAILKGGSDDRIYRIGGTDYYILGEKLKNKNYSLIFIQKYSDIVQSVNLVNKMMVSTLLIVIVLSFIAACIFSLWIYKPLDSLARNVRNCFNTKDIKGNNVYQEIGFAVNTLSSRNRDLETKYKLVLPYMENYSMHDWLTNKRTDTKNYKNILNALGIHFIYTWYMIALIDFENVDLTDDIMDRIKSFLNHCEDEFVFVLSRIKTNRIAIIINIDKNIETGYPIFQKMKSELNKEGIEITMSLGKLYDNLDNISENYEIVSRQLERKFFIGINEIIYSTNWYAEGQNMFFDKNIEEDLMNYIRFPNLEKARETFDRLLCDMQKNVNTVDYIKYNFFRIISDILFVLSEFGIDLTSTGFTSASIFNEIQKQSTLDSIRTFMDKILTKSISCMEKLKKSQHAELVERTIEYLKSNFQKDITLDDVSNAVFMSPRYLCGIFKTETGMTIFEYITKLRMEAAKDMLGSDRKVLDIALSLGYNNIQSFFRYFKKYYKMTPVQYRRKYFINTIA